MELMNIFFDTNMRYGHDGLRELLKKSRKASGGYNLFINKTWTAAKLLTADDVVLHVRRPKGLDPKALKYLPSCVQGGSLNYNKALEKALTEDYEIKH